MSRRRRPGIRGRDAAATLLLLGLFTGLRLLWADPSGADLHPTPDVTEYVGVAESWLVHGVPALELSDGALYPPRYSLGWPALIAAWRWITGGDQTSALSLTIMLSALTVCLVYLVGRHFAGRLGAFAAALLTMLSPRILDLTEMAMSEALAAFLVMAITGLIVIRSRRGGRLTAVLIGFLAGYLCAVRLTNVLLLVYLLPAVLLMRRRVQWSGLVWGLAGYIPWVIAIALSQAWLNGSLMRQGYDLWAPYATSVGQGWSWRFLLLPVSGDPGVFDGYRIHPHWQTYGGMLFGLPVRGYGIILYYSVPVAIGAAWALLTLRGFRKRWAWCLVAGVAVSSAVWGVYYFWAARFFMPLMPLVIILGCAGITPRLRAGWRPADVVRGLLLIAALVWQLHAGMRHMGDISVHRPWSQSERVALRALSEWIPEDAVVIIDTFHILARSELGSRRVMCWAVDGRDLLLAESRIYDVPPIHPADGRAAALFSGSEILPAALDEIAQAQADGREVWTVLHARQVETGSEDARMARLGFDLNDAEQIGIYRVWPDAVTAVRAPRD